MTTLFGDPALIDTGLDCRAITFENPTGARGAGGTAANGRKGAPMRNLAAGETVTLADIDGPGTIRHIWLTVGLAPPELMRAFVLEVFYDGADEPSISVPVLDFFGCAHGRPVDFHTALTAVQEGRGFNSYVPMPFNQHVRMTFHNGTDETVTLFYQLDLTLERDADPRRGYLHVPFRRENPTTMLRDFVIAEGIEGPGRYLGAVVGVRVLDEGTWYGEGEMKVYRDGDGDLPTICGTGLEDYVGTAWGMGAHAAPYGGAPLIVAADGIGAGMGGPGPDFVGFYRWHLADPIVFERDLRVTIQQIGSSIFLADQDEDFREFAARRTPAGDGWMEDLSPMLRAVGLYERADDYCAAAFIYARTPQPVPRVDVAEVVADVGRMPYEEAHPMELFRQVVTPLATA